MIKRKYTTKYTLLACFITLNKTIPCCHKHNENYSHVVTNLMKNTFENNPGKEDMPLLPVLSTKF